MSEPAWFRLLLLSSSCLVGLSLVGCADDRSRTSESTAVAPPSADAPRPRAADVKVLSDGSLEIGPRINDVATLERQPDGSYARRCGSPDPATRAMMEGALQGMMRKRGAGRGAGK